MQDNARRVALFRDELTAWVLAMDPSKTKGRGSDRQFYLAAWAILFFQAEDSIRDWSVTGVQTCALPILVAPTILAPATEATRQRYLRALYRGDIVACQLFSEPGAGSDLASLQTRAERDGDEWRIKIGRASCRKQRERAASVGTPGAQPAW